jgi:hypothetical protein
MRVLLRKITNGFYFQQGGRWVSNPEKGFDFGSIHQAMDFAEQNRPDHLELALAFDSSRFISAVSLKAAQSQLARSRVSPFPNSAAHEGPAPSALDLTFR